MGRASLPDPHYRHRFPAVVISHAVWLHHMFSLSLRDVELLLAERGIVVSYETVSMLDLARSVGAETIAEAIETREQARLMEQLGCTFGQGWLFGKAAPLPGVA